MVFNLDDKIKEELGSSHPHTVSPDIRRMLLKLHSINPTLINDFDWTDLHLPLYWLREVLIEKLNENGVTSQSLKELLLQPEERLMNKIDSCQEGDHPITDMFAYNKHPFPDNVEKKIRRLYKYNSIGLDDLYWCAIDWANKIDLHVADSFLNVVLREYGVRFWQR